MAIYYTLLLLLSSKKIKDLWVNAGRLVVGSRWSVVGARLTPAKNVFFL